MKLFYLVLGGVLGTVSRYLISRVVHEGMGHGFPYGTLAVNALGCFAIGFISTTQQGRFFSDDSMNLFLAVGFCGAFTTFSTFIYESAHLYKDSGYWHAFLNISLSILAGTAAFLGGHRLGKIL